MIFIDLFISLIISSEVTIQTTSFASTQRQLRDYVLRATAHMKKEGCEIKLIKENEIEVCKSPKLFILH